MLRIDNHIGMGFAGLTSDARVLSNYMRQLCLSSRLAYSRPLPVSRLISSLSDRAQLNTMQYGKRPYGVGFLVIGVDSQGPHLYEFSPTGNCFEYYAMALGARSQSAKTYLELKYESFPDMSLDELIVQGLYALRDSLQQGKDLELEAVSLAVVGPHADADASTPESRRAEKFRIIEGEPLKKWIDQLEKRGGPGRGDATAGPGNNATVGDVEPMEE